MSNIKCMLLSSLSVIMLSACSPSQDTAKSPAKDSTTKLDPATQKIMQTDLSESTPNDEIPVLSEAELKRYEETGSLPENGSEAETNVQAEVEEQPNEQFDIRVYRAESQGSMTGYSDKIDVVSLNDQPTTITGIQVNRGNCAVTSMYDYKNMRYGSVALAYPRCKVEHIREVSISTVNGTYAYRIG